MASETRSWLEHSARDLLHLVEISTRFYGIAVQFTHQTVYDFLTSSKMLSIVDQNVPAHFKELDFASRLAVARAKFVPCHDTTVGFGLRRLLLAMYKQWIAHQLPLPLDHLIEVDKVCCTYFKEANEPFAKSEWSTTDKRLYNGGLVAAEMPDCLLSQVLGFFIVRGSTKCAEAALTKAAARVASSAGLDESTLHLRQELLFATLGISSFPSSQNNPEDTNKELLRQTLNAGCNPNLASLYFPDNGRSAWHLFLRSWVRRTLPADYEPDPSTELRDVRPRLLHIDVRIWPVLKLLLEHGAEIEHTCCLAATIRCGLDHQRHSCCHFPVTDILEAYTPDAFQPELRRIMWEE
jgi:hypothetical protein